MSNGGVAEGEEGLGVARPLPGSKRTPESMRVVNSTNDDMA